MEDFLGFFRAKHELADAVSVYLPEALINLSFSGLVWLFGVLVFLPLAIKIDPSGLTIICSLIVLSAYSASLFKAYKPLKEIINAGARVLAFEWLQFRKKSETEKSLEQTRNWIIHILYVSTFLGAFLFASPLLNAVNPSINGIAFIILLFIVFWIFIKRTS